MARLIEIRSYALKPGTRPTFHRMMAEQVLPMLERWQVEVDDGALQDLRRRD